MSLESSDWQPLNAYADGELAEADARRLEGRLTVEADLRESLEDIRSLKRKLALMRPVTREPTPAAPPRRSSFGRKAAAIAAGLAIALLIGGGAYILAPQPTKWLGYARSLHAEQSRKVYVVEEKYMVQTVSGGQALEFRAPDLTASRLYLVDVLTPRWDDRETIAMHYRGLNGCRLTIVAIEADGDAAPAVRHRNHLIHTWAYQGFLFAVIAEGMDIERFMSAAEYARAVIVDSKRPDDGEMRTAMAETQRVAQPCA